MYTADEARLINFLTLEEKFFDVCVRPAYITAKVSRKVVAKGYTPPYVLAVVRSDEYSTQYVIDAAQILNECRRRVTQGGVELCG